MIGITFEFRRTKAVEAILYLANRISHPEKYNICKLLYLADKVSLEKYGRFIFGEAYVAMQNGATPSNAYDLLKKADCEPVDGISMKRNQIIPLRDADTDRLSESDIECLDQIIRRYGNQPIEGRKAAHDKAYQKSWDNRAGKRSNPIPVESIAELFQDSADLISYLSNSDV